MNIGRFSRDVTMSNLENLYTAAKGKSWKAWYCNNYYTSIIIPMKDTCHYHSVLTHT